MAIKISITFRIVGFLGPYRMPLSPHCSGIDDIQESLLLTIWPMPTKTAKNCDLIPLECHRIAIW